ncbi:MAG: tandem-95 repeat protein [Thermoplasmatales archaeon]|nr:MAG: tandem-95 repeat protein [Thermoplasmatales archaeon]
MLKMKRKSNRIFKKTIVLGIALIFITSAFVPAVSSSIGNIFIHNLYRMLTGSRDDVWEVPLDFSEPGGAYDNVFFGEKTDALDGLDSYDVPKSPPGVNPYIRAWFATNFSNPFNELFAEYKQYPDTNKIWNLTIQWVPSDYVSPTTITISWNPADFAASLYSSVILYNVNIGVNVANMLVDTNYAFTSPALALQNFEIICSQNQPPVANDDSAAVLEGSTNNLIDVLANDNDPDGDPLTIDSITQPGNGSVSTDGNYVYYTPNPGYNGPDQFTYSISDGNGGSDSATVYVTVGAVNDPPIANDDVATVIEDSLNNLIDVLSNDIDPDGDDLDILSVIQPLYGTVLYTTDYVYYTPDTNYSGLDQFEYTITDNNGGSDSAFVNVTVNGTNDPPTANNDTTTVIEDSVNNQIDVLANDIDIDGDTLTIISVTQPDNGSASTDTNYVYYTPDPDFNGLDQFEYTISDGNGETDTAFVYITVSGTNDPPTANDDIAMVDEDSVDNQIDVLANDIDIDGDPIEIIGVTTPTHGTANYTVDYVYYTPDPDYNGPDQFGYNITDNNGGTNSATVYITVGGTNDPPTANDDIAAVDEDSLNNLIDVLANDIDPDGDDLDIVSVTQPSNGLVLFTADYVYYTPDTNYNGLDQFNYIISDGQGGFDNATVFVVVNPVNDPPTANNDTATVDEDSIDNQIYVLVNDIDIDGDVLTVVSVTTPNYGNASTAGNYISYTPNPNYNGPDQFEYNISDSNGGFDTATVNVTVLSQNDPPTANDDNATVNEDSTNNVILVLNNDFDIDGDTISIINVSTPMNGTATATPNFVYYTPDPDYDGLDQFNYTISDNNGETDNATVYITVIGTNDPPNANADSFTVYEDTSLNELDVLANDNDPEGDILTITSVTQPTNGVVTFTPNYVYYTPNPDFVGNDAFTYSISDGNGGTDSAPVIIDVLEENDPPNIPSDPNPQNESTAVPFNANLSWSCSDPNGNPITYVVYFGTNLSPPIVAGNLSNSTYDPGMLDDETTYYWKIIAIDNHSAQTEGPLWHFTTAQNHPPFPPRNPNPEDGAIMVDPETIISWIGGDPDPGDIVTYDVYFGTISPPWQVVNNQSTTTYYPGTLDNLTTYYWKIVSWDYHGVSLEGPIWEFTTGILTNKAPTIPILSGPNVAGPNVSIDFSSLSTDREGDQIYYKWDWGDGTISEWLGPYESNQIATTNHSWNNENEFFVRVKSKDSYDEESDWSETHNVSVAQQIKIIEPQPGFVMFDLLFFNRTYFYIAILDFLNIAGYVTILGTIDVTANATNNVHTVKFQSNYLLIGENDTKIDDNSSDGFTATLEMSSTGLVIITVFAYDEEGNLIDRNIVNLIYIYIKRQGGGGGSPPTEGQVNTMRQRLNDRQEKRIERINNLRNRMRDRFSIFNK